MPPPWFDDLAVPENPGREELIRFVQRVQEFLKFVLLNPAEFGFLWQDDPALRDLATDTFENDVSEGVGALTEAIPNTSPDRLSSHGLRGRALRFKFSVLAAISRRWNNVRGQFAVRGWFKQVCDAIDAILDSLVQAAGTGGVLKEFKDALAALAKERE